MGFQEPLLTVEGLTVVFQTKAGYLTANNGVSFSQTKGEWLAIMGPSGSGKSVLAKSISGIMTGVPGIVEGRILFRGNDLLAGCAQSVAVSRKGDRVVSVSKNVRKWNKRYAANMRTYARNQFSYVFQNPYDALNPYFPVKRHLREAFRAGKKGGDRPDDRSVELLASLQIASPAETLKMYPHELSGGMAQRVVIAMALAQGTSVIIADECTTSLDPSSAVSTVEALQHARKESGCSILFITHDVGIAETYSDRILRFGGGQFLTTS